MKILMLGWEYPPHISGGLGTACEGLTTALARRGIEIDFLVPRLYGQEDAPHMHLLGAAGATPPMPLRAPVVAPAPPEVGRSVTAPISSDGSTSEPPADETVSVPVETPSSASGDKEPLTEVRVVRVPAMLKPYLDEATYRELVTSGSIPRQKLAEVIAGVQQIPDPPKEPTKEGAVHLPAEELPFAEQEPVSPEGVHYGDDLFAEVARYAMAAAHRVNGRKYDLVHAHDWMTFPAGVEIARRAGAPLLVHVHSLEYDRAGKGADPDITSVERQGLEYATRVVAVSYYTRGLINRVHATPLDKISVVHNGVYARETVQAYTQQRRSQGPVVLFLGRVTFQKGPEYFVQAAARVLQHVPNAVFMLAGSGDMLPRMQAMVEDLGITDSFRFPGWLKGAEIERAFSTADVYVMPSVSEPFGIAPLEAMSYDRPVIVSKQSGVSEVLRNALKVDFWDVDKMASQIVALLELPELRRTIVERAREEIRHIHWDAAADKLVPVYESVIRA
jgi:glycosyltransferase involved in cell wall biosynthesis